MSEIIYCAIYARYSTNNQRPASIEDQIRNCRDTAKAKGWVILEDHIYCDRAQSGTKMASRDEFKKMMRVAMSGNSPFQRIIVDETSRVARNTKGALDVFSLLTFYGVYVYYITQGIDTASDTAEEMITINGLIDSLYIRNLAKETHRGIKGQVLSGYSGGGRRYGYYSVPVFNGKVDIYGNPEADGYILKINPEEAETIIRIFTLYSEGISVIRIVNMLNKEIIENGGPKPPRGEFWRISTILGSKKLFRGILNNEIYIGRYYWDRVSSKINPENGKIKFFSKDPAKWVFVEKPELRIISQELWEKVQRRRKQLRDTHQGRYTKAQAAYSLNLVTGLMTCSLCGGNIVVVSGGKWGKYGCSNNWNKGSAVCGNNMKFRKFDLEELVVNSMNMDFAGDVAASYISGKVNSIIRARFAEKSQKWRGQAFAEQLKKVNKDIASYIKAIEVGIVSETLKTQLESAEKRKKDIEALLLQEKKEAPIIPLVAPNTVIQYLQNIHDMLNLQPVYGRTFLSRIIDKVIIDPNNDTAGVRIICRNDGILEGKCIAALIPAHVADDKSGSRDSAVVKVVTECGGHDVCQQ